MLTLVRIHNVVWVRTPCSLVHGYECSGGAFWASLHREYFPNENSLPTNQITQSISRNTIILNLNLHFLLTVSLFITNPIHTYIRE